MRAQLEEQGWLAAEQASKTQKLLDACRVGKLRKP